MADNVTADAGTGGATFAADDILGVHYPRTKLVIGADGTNDGDVSSANPLPVTGTVAVTNAGLTELAGAINASAQMDVNIAASNATVTVDGSGVTQPVSHAALTELAAAINVSSQVDVNIAASGATVPVSGTFWQATQPVSGTFWQATQPVSLASVPSHAVTNAGTFAVQPGPTTSGGCSIFRSLDLDETEEEVTTSAGQIYGWSITNFATAVRHIKFYNATAANTTVGTTTPLMTISVPGNATDDTQSVFSLGGMGIPFSTALSVAATTGLADNDTGAPGASDVSITLFYK